MRYQNDWKQEWRKQELRKGIAIGETECSQWKEKAEREETESRETIPPQCTLPNAENKSGSDTEWRGQRNWKAKVRLLSAHKVYPCAPLPCRRNVGACKKVSTNIDNIINAIGEGSTAVFNNYSLFQSHLFEDLDNKAYAQEHKIVKDAGKMV